MKQVYLKFKGNTALIQQWVEEEKKVILKVKEEENPKKVIQPIKSKK